MPALLELLQIAAGMGIGYGVFSQILLPLFNGTPLFSAFTEKTPVEAELQAATRELEIANLERRISELKDQTKQTKGETSVKY